MKILNEIWHRVEIDKEDSDIAYFFSLMYAGELLTKLITCTLVSFVENDTKNHKYSLMYKLVRANSIGDWSKAINEVVDGPTSHFLSIQIKDVQKEIIQKFKADSWQHQALRNINQCLIDSGEDVEEISTKASLKTWFQLFTRLRNKTRGHGATQSSICSILSPNLENSIRLICDNLKIFKFEWTYLSQNLSGKYKISSISNSTPSFRYLKTSDGKNERYINGVYVYINRPILIELIKSDSDLNDFYFPNGSFSKKRYEVISYSTGNLDSKDNSAFLIPPGELPKSETQGTKSLGVIGNCFTNIPLSETIYIKRTKLEDEVKKILLNDRHPIVSLVGRGGIGKTSLALKILADICYENRFSTILWFSSRDIDLLQEGAKSVQPQVLDIDDVANEFTNLICSEKLNQKGFITKDYFEKQIQKYDIGSLLVVFDNFETVKNPIEMFSWLDTHIRLPNKVLITSRINEFVADYPITVSGMNEVEFTKLVNTISKKLQISHLLTKDYINKLYEESGGHPYVAKILIGVVANEGKAGNIDRIIAGQDELLTALFERTYNHLSKAAKRVFLTLASWRSTIPKIGIEAILTKTASTNIDVETAIEELNNYSLIDIHISKKDKHKFISIPLSAFLFGKRKLSVSPFKHPIQADRELLMMFGTGKIGNIDDGADLRFEKFFSEVAKVINGNKTKLNYYMSILEYVCRKNNKSWLTYSHLLEENILLNKSIIACENYIQNETDLNRTISVWKRLAFLHRNQKDYLGEIHSLIEMCEIDETSNASVTTCANRLNKLLAENRIVNKDEKDATIKRMICLMKNRFKKIDKNNLDNMTNLAWLYIHNNQISDARKIINSVLDMDNNHVYANKIQQKIGKGRRKKTSTS